MEISRNKLVLFIIAGVIAFFMAMILILMLVGNKKTTTRVNNINDFVVWTVGDNQNINPLADDFKAKYKINGNIVFRSFDSFEDYNLALTYAFNSGTAPDVFVMNNNQSKSLFSNKVIGINPSIVNPADFRKNYKPYIADQLITKNEENVEYLIGLPVGYETLGIFYNRKFINQSEISTLSSLRNTISKLRQDFPTEIPIAIGNGTTVPFSEDIFTQMMLISGGSKSIDNIDDKVVQSAISEYSSYGDMELDNRYNEKYLELKASNDNSINLFANGQTFMVAGYPRLINEISNKGFSPSFLLATAFPVESRNSASLVNFNYFVINADSNKIGVAENFISYLSSEAGMKKYFEVFPYYLPAANILDSQLNSQSIHPKYNISIGDFYNPTYTYTGFDKSMIDVYNKEVRNLLDDPVNAIMLFSNMKSNISCKTGKIFNLIETEKSCN